MNFEMLIGDIVDIFTSKTMLRALAVGASVSVCTALLGVVLVLKSYSMIGDGLSHLGLGVLSVSLVLGIAPMWVSVPSIMVAAVLLLHLSESSSVRGDSVIAVISTSSIALSVIVTAAAGGLNSDVWSYMFGSVLAVSRGDAIAGVLLSLAVIATFVLFYNRIFAVCADERFARASGVNVRLCKLVLSIMIAITVAVGMRLVGTMLISGLIVFPALSAMSVTKRYRTVVILSAVISLSCFTVGLIASYVLGLPSGAGIVAVNLICLLICRIVRLARSFG